MPVSPSITGTPETRSLPNPPPKARANYLRDFLIGALPLLFSIQFLAWLAFFPNALRGHADFRQLYAAGYLVCTGHSHELYDYGLQRQVQDSLVSNDERALPFIRPAYQALLFAPFSFISYRTAYLAFLIVNLGALVLCFVLLRDNLGNLKNEWWGLPPALFLAFYPVSLAIMQGQDSILLVACLCASLLCLRRGRQVSAGLLLGLGFFKPQIVIPVTVLFYGWRSWKFLAGFTITSGILTAVSMRITGWPQTLVFIRSLLSVGVSTNPADPIKFPLRVTLMANLRGLIAGLFAGHLPTAWIQVATVVASILVLIWVGSLVPRNHNEDELFSIAIVASVFVSYYLFIHDLAALLIPIVVTLNRFISCQTSGVPSGFAKWTAAALLIAPMLVFLTPGHFYLVSLLIGTFLFIVVQARQEGIPPAGSRPVSANH